MCHSGSGCDSGPGFDLDQVLIWTRFWSDPGFDLDQVLIWTRFWSGLGFDTGPTVTHSVCLTDGQTTTPCWSRDISRFRAWLCLYGVFKCSCSVGTQEMWGVDTVGPGGCSSSGVSLVGRAWKLDSGPSSVDRLYSHSGHFPLMSQWDVLICCV